MSTKDSGVVGKMSETMDRLLAANFMQGGTMTVMGALIWYEFGSPWTFFAGVAGIAYSLFNLFFIRGVTP